MRTAITLIRKHGEKKFVLVSDPSVAIADQHKAVREVLASGGTHKEIAEVQIWESDSGLHRTVRLEKPEDREARNKSIAAEMKAHEETQAKDKKKAKVQPKTDEKKADEPKAEEAQAEAAQDL